jgi:hypothetical protein
MINSIRARYPNAYRNFMQIKNGSNRFVLETISFTKTKFYLARDEKHIQKMTWKEIEIYRQLPRDWRKVFPVTAIAAFPFLNYVILPLAFIYPEQLLCRHFWSEKQQIEFGERVLIKRLPLNKTVLNDLLVHTDKFSSDKIGKNLLIDTINKVHNGARLNEYDIIELSSILNKPEFGLSKLSGQHLKNLTKLNNCATLLNLNPLKRLQHYGQWLAEFDRLLIKEDLTNIEKRYILDFCIERGINVNKVSNYIKLVKSRLELTCSLTESQTNFTLLLHSNALLANMNN